MDNAVMLNDLSLIRPIRRAYPAVPFSFGTMHAYGALRASSQKSSTGNCIVLR